MAIHDDQRNLALLGYQCGLQKQEDGYADCIDRKQCGKTCAKSPVVGGVIAASSTAGAVTSIILREPEDTKGQTLSIYITNFATGTAKAMIGKIPIIPRVALYGAATGMAFLASSFTETGRKLFPFVTGCAIKFGASDVQGYIGRANNTQGTEDEEESDEEGCLESQPWLFSKEGCGAAVEGKIETALQPVVSRLQDEEGIPYRGTRITLTTAITLCAIATNIFAQDSFGAYCMLNFLRKVLKPVIKPTPLIPRWGAHGIALGAGAFVDFSGLVNLPFKVFPRLCDFSFSLLTMDIKKGQKGALSENPWWFTCGSNKPQTHEFEALSQQDSESLTTSSEPTPTGERSPPATWKQVATVVTTLGATIGAQILLPGSLAALYAMDLFCGSVKPVVQRIPMVPRYAALAALITGGYVLESIYPSIPAGTIASGLAAKTLTADIRKSMMGKTKKLAPWFFCATKKEKPVKVSAGPTVEEVVT